MTVFKAAAQEGSHAILEDCKTFSNVEEPSLENPFPSLANPGQSIIPFQGSYPRRWHSIYLSFRILKVRSPDGSHEAFLVCRRKGKIRQPAHPLEQFLDSLGSETMRDLDHGAMSLIHCPASYVVSICTQEFSHEGWK